MQRYIVNGIAQNFREFATQPSRIRFGDFGPGNPGGVSAAQKEVRLEAQARQVGVSQASQANEVSALPPRSAEPAKADPAEGYTRQGQQAFPPPLLKEPS